MSTVVVQLLAVKGTTKLMGTRAMGKPTQALRMGILVMSAAAAVVITLIISILIVVVTLKTTTLISP